MEMLGDHYDDILQSIGMRLREIEDTENTEKAWTKTWALGNPEYTQDHSRHLQLGRGELPLRDREYLKQGKLERRKRALHSSG